MGAVDWRAEGDKLLRYYPVEVAILHSLIILILGKVEVFETVPAQLAGPFQRLETVRDLDLSKGRYSALVGAGAAHGIPEAHEFLARKGLPRLLRRPLQDQHLECAHQICGVSLLPEVLPAVVVYLCPSVLVLVKNTLQFCAEDVRLP